MNKSDSIDQLVPALLAFHKTIKKPVLDAINDYLGNKYASLSSLIDHVKPDLMKNDLMIIQFPSVNGYVENVLVHKSGQWISEVGGCGSPGLTNPQQVAGAITYSKRYGVASILFLAGDPDDDGNTAVGTETKPMANTPDGDSLMINRVKSVKDRQAGKYTIYDVTFEDGMVASTFDQPLAVLATEASKSNPPMEVEVQLEANRFGWKIVELRPAPVDPAKAEDDDLPF